MSQLKDNYRYSYIATQTTTQVDTGQGQLVRVIISETAAGAITIADSASTTTPVIVLFKASVAEGSYEVGVNYFAGLNVTTAAASKLTLVYASIGA